MGIEGERDMRLKGILQGSSTFGIREQDKHLWFEHMCRIQRVLRCMIIIGGVSAHSSTRQWPRLPRLVSMEEVLLRVCLCDSQLHFVDYCLSKKNSLG